MGRPCSTTTFLNSSSSFSSSFLCFSFLPIMLGICLRRWPMMSRCVLKALTRLTNSFTLRSHARLGMVYRSLSRSPISFSKSSLPSAFFSVLGGLPLKVPTYTLHTSGVLNTFPSDHISAPYTLMSCCASTWSALFSTTRTLSSLPFRLAITLRNSSEISSLCGSKSSRMRSDLCANHSHTLVKSYVRSMRCFSPDSTPGVSTKVTWFKSFASHCEPSSFARKLLPNTDSCVKGLSGCTTSVLPGTRRSSWLWWMITKRSVVGSGPM
mmetsp:Transcript_12780/g.44396  ORF Transcript_12780/g.44396 Transcript_12780/m.44396 type:complete len:267 (+) Transcript_12780:704-1504(+)